MRAVAAGLSALLLFACSSVPRSRYGVRTIRVRGMHAMDEESLRNCLSMSERPRAGMTLGVHQAGDCGEPPFDANHLRVSLWAWPWTEWSLFDRVALRQDVRRIERWYQARGHHEAKVVSTRVTPAQAERNDTIEGRDPDPGCERNGRNEGCTVDIEIRVEEGRPTYIGGVSVRGLDALRRDERDQLGAIDLHRGERFDEALYDLSKKDLLRRLGDLGYARATVTGVVRIDRPRRRASIELTVVPGPRCVFGWVRVVGVEGSAATAVRAATLIRHGEPFRSDDLEDAQTGVFGLGAFASVLVEPVLPREGNVVPVRVTVSEARHQRLGLGVGVQSGVIEAGQGLEKTSVPQWDVHLSARYTNRDFLGGLRQLTLEERPRLIVQESFPGFDTPRIGNLVSAELRQPAFLEPRTRGVLNASHDYGPDPFDTFFRHRIDTGAMIERFFFFKERLFLAGGIRNSLYFVDENAQPTQAGDAAPVSSVLTFYEQQVRVDFRDKPQNTHSGFLLSLTAQEAGFGLPSSWQYLRFLPDARAYVPLPWAITLAARVAVGTMSISSADPGLDPLSRQLGPRDFRLRGGGAASNRGFLPGRLGDGPEGGTRRWEASLELRVPISDSLGTVFFADAGDVSRLPTFRLDHPQTSVGFGLRYFTFVGALRVDFAYRVPGLQILGTDLRDPGGRETDVDFGIFSFPGAVHISLGEAF